MIQTDDLIEAMPNDVRAAFDAMPARLHARFAELRARIRSVAQQDPRIGPLDENLKWGEPAYRPSCGAGSTVRLAVSKAAPECCGVFFVCSTGLVDEFRARFPDLMCEGNRAVLIDPEAPIPDALDICLHRAMTYHLKAS